MTTMCNGLNQVQKNRRKLGEPSTSAKLSRAPFRLDEHIKKLQILAFIDYYNHHIGAVDIGNQLQTYYLV